MFGSWQYTSALFFVEWEGLGQSRLAAVNEVVCEWIKLNDEPHECADHQHERGGEGNRDLDRSAPAGLLFRPFIRI